MPIIIELVESHNGIHNEFLLFVLHHHQNLNFMGIWKKFSVVVVVVEIIIIIQKKNQKIKLSIYWFPSFSHVNDFFFCLDTSFHNHHPYEKKEGEIKSYKCHHTNIIVIIIELHDFMMKEKNSNFICKHF